MKKLVKKFFAGICTLAVLLSANSVAEEMDQTHASEETDPEEIMIELEDGLEEKEPVLATGEILSENGIFNILLLGTDERTQAFDDNARADTCMLVSINTKTMAVHLVSFERGMGVPVLEGEYEGQWDWLTHMFQYGGADLMMREIGELFKLDVDYYARMNISTFMQMIDAVGGVDIELTKVEANYINHPEGTYAEFHIRDMVVGSQIQEAREGVNRLNGATAMLYARCRWTDNDWQRVERQRNVLKSLAGRVKTMSLPEIIKMLELVLPYIETNLTAQEMVGLALSMAPKIKDISIEQLTIPEEGTYGSMKGMKGRSMYAVDFEKNAELLAEVLYAG